MTVVVDPAHALRPATDACACCREAIGNGRPVLDRCTVSDSPLRSAHFPAQLPHETGAPTIESEKPDHSAARLRAVRPSRFETEGPLDPQDDADDPSGSPTRCTAGAWATPSRTTACPAVAAACRSSPARTATGRPPSTRAGSIRRTRRRRRARPGRQPETVPSDRRLRTDRQRRMQRAGRPRRRRRGEARHRRQPDRPGRGRRPQQLARAQPRGLRRTRGVARRIAAA